MAERTITSAKLQLEQKKEKSLKAIAKEPLVFNELDSDVFRDGEAFDWIFVGKAMQTAKLHYERRITLASTSDEGQRVLEEAKETHKQMQETIQAETLALEFQNCERAKKTAQLEELTELYNE